MARRTSILLALVTGLLTACEDPGTEPLVPTTLLVSPELLSFEALGTTAGLTASVHDQHGRVMTKVAVSWQSSGPGVATVDQSGVVTATGNGTAHITATAGEAGDSVGVTVEQRPVSLAISPRPVRFVALGDTTRLTAEVLDPNGRRIAGAAVTWTVADTTILTVDDEGLATAAGNGTTTIGATSGGLADSVTAEVEQEPAQVRISPADDTLGFETLGDTVRLSAEVLDANGHPITGAPVDWSISDTSVATIDQGGLVTARGNGAATVFAHTRGATGSIRVEVDQVPVSIEVVAPTDLLAIGDSIRMTARAFDAGGSPIEDADFTWASSDTTVASVSPEGWVRAHADGSVDIKATLKGLSASVPLVTGTQDKIALLSLFRSANGKSWSRSNNWGTDAPLDEWYGIEVDDQGRVHSLSLPLNNLAGTIPPEIGRLTELREVFLYVNRLEGALPPEIGQLTKLQELHLEVNLLEGALPPEIGRLDSLQWLGLYGNELSGPIPAEVGRLAELQILDLSFNSFTGSIPPALTRLSNLSYLGLYSNELSGEIPPRIGDLAKLRLLNLGHNRLTGPIPPEIGNLRNLESLLLFGIDTNPEEGNRLTGTIPPEIGNLANLNVLNLGANRLEGPIPPELGKLTELDSLALYSNLLTEIPPELGQLTGLQYISLYGNRLTGEIPVEIGDLTKLHTLLLGRGYTSGNNRLTGRIPSELGDLVRLEWLDLGGNDLTGEIPARFGRLTKLEFLELGSNGLSGRIPPELGKLTRLTRLAVCPNELSGPIPGELGDLRELYYLFVCSNNLAGPLPREIGNLTNLRFLRLGDNQLTGEIPGTMLAMTHLLEFLWQRNDGLCAPRTEEFEEWLDSIPTSSDIYCESASPAPGPGESGVAGPGGCSVTVDVPPPALGLGGRWLDGGMGVLAARLGARRGGQAPTGPPGTFAVSCEERSRRWSAR